MTCRIFDRADLDQYIHVLPLRVTGTLANASPGAPYEGRLQIRNSIGPCSVQQIGGAALPPGSSLYVDNITKEVVVAWPAYQETGVIPIAGGNGNFEAGDTGWEKGVGWTIEASGGDNDGFGAGVGVYRGQGESFMEAQAYAPTFPGQAFTAQVNVQQGASSKHNVGAGIGVRYYDLEKNPLALQLGTFIDDGSKGAWHMSTGSFQTPAGAFLARAVIRGARFRENKRLWVDDASWTLQGVLGINFMTMICITIRVRDSAGRIADWSGCVSVGSPSAGISASVRHWWNMDENSSAAILADQTGNAALTMINKGNATFGGAALRGGGGSSIRFTSSAGAQSGYFPAWIGETDDYCVAAWVKLDAATHSAERTIISDAPADDSTADVNFRVDVQVTASGEAAAFWEYGVGVDEIVVASPPISTAAHFLVVARDAATGVVRCHIDGVPVSSVPYLNAPTGGRSPTKRLVVGNIQSAGRPFNGFLQDVCVFDRPLTDTEVEWLYNAGQGRSYADVTADAPVPSEPLAVEYLNATESTHDWANLTGWTVSGVQVSGNALYGTTGGNPAAAGRAFSVAAGETVKLTAEIVNVAGNAGTQYVGLNFGGASDGVVASLPAFVGVGIGTASRVPVRFAGASFTGITTGNVNLSATTLGAGTYRATVVIDAQNISLTLQHQDGTVEYSETIPRSAAPNGGAITSIIVWNGATNGLSGSHVKALGVKKSLTPFRTKSNAAGTIEGNTDFLIHRNIGDGWRIQLPPWMDGLRPVPVVVFFHQASTGNRNNPIAETRWSDLRKGLSSAGYAIISADDGGDRWGNPASVANYAALLNWLKGHVWVGDVFLLGCSMGGLPMFNTITHGTMSDVRAAVALSAVCNLVAMRSNATFTAAIDAAWGSSSDPTLIANSAGYNPTARAGSDFSGLPYMFNIASTDSIVPPAAHTNVLAPMIAPYAVDTIVNGGLGSTHLAVQQYNPDLIVPFFNEYRS